MIGFHPPLADQTCAFAQAVLLGAGSGLFYDLCRAVRARCPAGRWGTALFDGLFCLGFLIAVPLFLLLRAGGQVRLFLLLGIACGGVLYALTLHPPVRRLLDFLLRLLVRLIRGIVRLVWTLIAPLRAIVRRLAALFAKLYKKIQKNTSISRQKGLQ